MRAPTRAFLMMGLRFQRGPAHVEIVRMEVGKAAICRYTGDDYPVDQHFALPLPQFYEEYRLGHIVDLRTQNRPTQLIAHGARQLSARWQLANDAQKNGARRKERYILEMRKLGPISFDMATDNKEVALITQQLRALGKGFRDPKPPSRTTFWRWYSTYIRGGEAIESLLPRRRPTGSNRASRLLPQVEEALQKALDEVIGGSKKSIVDLAEDIKATLVVANERRFPHEPEFKIHTTTIARRVNQLPQKVKLARKFGEEEAERRLRDVQKVEDPDFPLQVVQTDHTYFAHVTVWDEELKKRHKGIFLTAFIDRRTRMCLGYCVHIRRHDTEVVERCLTMAILPKTHFKLWCPEAVGEWPCFGLPFKIVFDNGREFLADALMDLCERIAIHCNYAIGETPEYKGTIERWFRTLKDRLKRLRSPEMMKKRPGLPRDCMTLRELDAEVGRWIVDTYHHSPHSALGKRKPIDVWNAEIDNVHRPLASSVDDVLATVGQRDRRKLTSKGIEFGCDFYYSPELKDLLVKLGPDAEKVTIVYSSRTAHYIFVVDPIDETYIKATNANSRCLPEFTREHWEHVHEVGDALGVDVATPIGAGVALASVAAKDAALIENENASPAAVAKAARRHGTDLFGREAAEVDARAEKKAAELIQRVSGSKKRGKAPSPPPAVEDAVEVPQSDLTSAPLKVTSLRRIDIRRLTQ